MREVSVIVPAFNASRFIGNAIRSISAQTVSVAQIIVIDDGSTDNTGRVAVEAASNVTLVRQNNRGPSAARNKGLEIAQGELVAFLDSDDIWMTNKIERQLVCLSPEDRVSGIATSFEICNDSGQPLIPCLIKDSELRQYTPLQFLASPKITPSTLLIDRRVVGDIRFPESIVDGEDLVFVSMLRTKGSLRAVEDILVRRQRHRDQLTQLKGHFSRSVQNRVQWLRQNRMLLNLDSDHSEGDFWEATVNNVLSRLWVRDIQGFKAWRSELLDIWPQDRPVPDRLLIRTYPRWVYLLKDSFDRFIGRIHQSLADSCLSL
jgi:glycosyltransferase involved in cell wall biosynthesis